MMKTMSSVRPAGLLPAMQRVSGARMATGKPQGWVHASLGMGGRRPAVSRLSRKDLP